MRPMTKSGSVMEFADSQLLRPVKDSDAEALVELIGGCYSEYEGVFLDLDDLDSDLKVYATYIAARAGEAYVLETKGEIDACVAFAKNDSVFELKRMYLRADKRGRDIAIKLLKYIEMRAQANGATELHAWSDDRFIRAHHFYAREGYVLQKDENRFLHDISNSTEILFIKHFD